MVILGQILGCRALRIIKKRIYFKMTIFQQQFQEVKDLLQFNDYHKVINRIIDFTLDTEQIDF